MKKFLFMCCALALPACLLFTACNDDDESKTLAQTVEGTYPVDIRVGLGSAPDPSSEAIDASVIVKAAGDNTVNLELKGFSLDGENEVPISLNGITVSGSEGNVTMAYNGVITSDALAALGHISGSLSGTVKSAVMDLLLNIEVRMSDASAETPDLVVIVSVKSK